MASSMEARGLLPVSQRARVLLLLATGLFLRLALAPFGSYRGDMHQFRGWASQLGSAPLSSFYGSRHLILDHLPGDLWILLGVEKLHKLLPVIPFVFLIKLVPAIADTAIAWVLYRVGKKLWAPYAGFLAAALFTFNPAVLFLTAIWGQWDSLSALFALTAVWFLLEMRIGWGMLALTAALLIKPPFAALIPLFGLVVIGLWMDQPKQGFEENQISTREIVRGVTAGLGGSILLAALVLLPFDVGAPPYFGHWSLIGRISYAWNYRTYTSTNAFNLWGLPFGNGRWRDSHHFLLSLTFEQWGKALTAIALVVILVLYWRKRSQVMLLWAAFATTFSTFLLSTRQHERYLLPAVMFAALAAVVVPRARSLYSLISLTFFINLYAIYVIENPAPHPSFPQAAPELRYLISSINVVLLGYTLFLGAKGLILQTPSRTTSLSEADFETAGSQELRT